MDFPETGSQNNLIQKLYKNVANTSEVRKVILTEKLPFTLINPRLVIDSFQLDVAVAKALHNRREGTMTTRSFQTEILYYLSPSKNIKDALTGFGTQEDDSEFIIIGDRESFANLASRIQGDEVPVSDVSSFAQQAMVQQLYQVSDEELSNSSLLQSVVSRISSKDFTVV